MDEICEMRLLRYLLVLCLIILVSGCIQQTDRMPGNETENAWTGEPASIREIEENCVGFLVGDPNEAMTVSLIGGTIVRPHPGPFSWESIEPTKGDFNFEEPDSWIRKIQEHDVYILATLWPFAGWDQETCHSGECDVPEGIFSPASDDMKDDKPEEMKDDKVPPSSVSEWRCAPCNYDDYKSFLKVLVERYDGDGNDDMPGLEIPVRYWEISNEPDMQEGYLTFFRGSPQDYVDILEASYEAIKEACPGCMVVQGGAAGTDDDMMTFWDSVFAAGGGDYFDIGNIHYVNQGDLDTLNVKDFKELMDKHDIAKPIWVTEAEFSDENAVSSSLEGALEAGASKVFFTKLLFGKTGPPEPNQYSDAFIGIAGKCQDAV